MNHEIATLALLSQRDAYNNYGRHVPDAAVSPEVFALVRDFGDYFAAFPNDASVAWEKFKGWHAHTSKPELKKEQRDVVNALLNQAAKSGAIDADLSAALVSGWRNAALAAQLAEVCITAKQGQFKEPLGVRVSALLDKYSAAPAAEKSETFTFDSPQYLERQAATGGWDWHVEELNQSIGALRRGYFILVAGRPEIGKTTLVVSETAALAAQGAAPILWINNEEAGARILTRYISCVLGVAGGDIDKNPKKAAASMAARKFSAGLVQMFDAHGKTLTQIEAVIRKIKPAIVVLHRLDKLPPPGDRGDKAAEDLQALGIWARNLATTQNCAVIGVVQADKTADGYKYPTDAQIHNSKTGLQSESDATLMIGADSVDSPFRGINVPRNKIAAGPRVIDTKHYAKFDVKLDRVTGRYSSAAYPKKHPWQSSSS